MRSKLFQLCVFMILGCNSLYAQIPVKIDISKLPFSYKGAYMVLSLTEDVPGEQKLYLKDISGNRMWLNNNIFLLEAYADGKPEKATITATSSKVTLQSATGTIEFCFQDDNIIRLRGNGTGLKMTQIAKDQSNLIMPTKTGQWRVQQGGNAHYVFTALKGTAAQFGERYTLNADGLNNQVQGEVYFVQKPDENGKFESAIDQYPYGWAKSDYSLRFDDCVSKANKSLLDWVNKVPEVGEKYKAANLAASYLNWSCVVKAQGFINHDIIYTSKGSMRAVWAWDHCFTAMDLAYKDPVQAWNNFMIFFDHQNETGSFPDFMNDRQALWGFSKPPIHGWALKKMMNANPVFTQPKYLNQIYKPLEKWTNFWFKYRDDDHDSIPEYHHGNDSGWDNATIFDAGFQAESPDLSAYLVIQMDVLAEIAQKLGKPKEAKIWKAKADKQLGRLIKNLWNGEQFVNKRMDDNSVYDKSQCLMKYLPLVLGNRLPKYIGDKMIADLKTNGQFTKIGLASENPNSTLYRANSYWRGPVWAAPTFIIASGAFSFGDKEFAKEIAKRYCDNCTINGFAENYDALTGEGLRDRSITWTSSVFQIMAHEYLLK